MSARTKKYSLEDFKHLTKGQLDLLKTNQVKTISALAACSEAFISGLLEVKNTTAQKILHEARTNIPDCEFTTAEQLVRGYEDKAYLSTGCKDLDNLLGGKGFESSATTLLSGAYGSGKSQICLTAAVRGQLSEEKKGLNGSIVFIDVEQTLRPERVREISTSLGVDPAAILKNIRVLRPKDTTEQILAVKKLIEPGVPLEAILGPLDKPPRVLIIDSITAKFRTQYIGRGTLAERQQKLNEHLADCHEFALKYNAVVLFTNHVIGNPDPFSGVAYSPAGGHVLGHAATYNLMLKKLRYKRVADLIDSAHLPCGQAFYQIAAKGVCDIDDEENQTFEGPEASLRLD